MFCIIFFFVKVIIKELKKKDYKKAKAYAIKGMHLDWFSESKLVTKIYGSYFWHSELNRATDVIAAYDENDDLLGVLLANVDGKDKARFSKAKERILKFAKKLEDKYASDAAYDKANEEMLSECKKRKNLDGEILFLAADPDKQGKGTGSALISELKRREKGKNLFLYTDDGCNYKFYEKKGFIREGERDVEYNDANPPFVLRCFLYSVSL